MVALINNDDIVLKQDEQLEQIYLAAVELCDETLEVERCALWNAVKGCVPQGSFGKMLRVLVETGELVPVAGCVPAFMVGSLRADERIPEIGEHALCKN